MLSRHSDGHLDGINPNENAMGVGFCCSGYALFLFEEIIFEGGGEGQVQNKQTTLLLVLILSLLLFLVGEIVYKSPTINFSALQIFKGNEFFAEYIFGLILRFSQRASKKIIF